MKIHTEAARGDTTALRYQLDSGIPVDVLDENGQTPLMCAIASPESNLETIKLLLDRGANPNAIGGELGYPVLAYAVKQNDLRRIELLLEAGADIAVVSEGGYDALIWAIHSDDEYVLPKLNFLIERGAPLLGESEYGESALSVSSNRGRFDVVQRLLEVGADETRLEWSPLHHAIALGTIEEVKALLQQGANLSDKDGWERTPWLLSLCVGDIEKSKLLLDAGANRDDTGRCGKTALIYPIENNNPDMLGWLLEIGCDPDAVDDFNETALMEAASYGSAACVRLLLEAGADPDKTKHGRQKAITNAASNEVIRLLVGAGQDLNDLASDARASLLGFDDEGEPDITPEGFESGRYVRFGTSNPEKMDVPFWNAMVKSGATAYRARAISLPKDKIWDEGDERNPVWCYHRFGQSITQLPDGRFIEIGGEHEDYYDPDFCIYNDVFVHHPDGSFEIYGYPTEIFPPTDFHTATLVGDYIYIIGNMGYPEHRIVGYTPVYRLNINTFAIEKVEIGGENSDWISRHKAIRVGDEIHVLGGQVWTAPEDDADGEEDFEDDGEEEDDVESISDESEDESPQCELPVDMEELMESFDIDEIMKSFEEEEQQEEERERTHRSALHLPTLSWRRISP